MKIGYRAQVNAISRLGLIQCFFLLNFLVNAQDHSSSSSGFILQEGSSTVGDIVCRGSGLQLDGASNILSLASWVPGDYGALQTDQSGKCLFNESLNLLDWFSTEFTFTLAPHAPGVKETIDGMAFLINEDTQHVGMSRGYLGVTDDGSYLHRNFPYFAVEFDAFTNPEFEDPPFHHVGIDVNHSMISTVTTQAGYYDTNPCTNTDTFIALNLTGDGRIQAWIEYNGSTQQLSVFLSSLLGIKPLKPLLTADVNLSAIFSPKTDLFVGFSASSGQLFSGWAYVLDWSFNVSGSATSLYPNREVQVNCPSRAENVGPMIRFTIPVTFLVVALGAFLVGRYFLRVRKGLHDEFQLIELENLDCRPNQYRYEELRAATDNFSPQQELGRGGYGIVYRGTLSPGEKSGVNSSVSIIAVKRILPRNRRSEQMQNQEEHVSEVKIIGRLRHRNLVQLLGWSTQKKKGELLLVYEYMPNGSLDQLLFSKSQSSNQTVLTWSQRFNVITGVASALVYLHEGWKQLVVHRDVKASNVMLDFDFNARLGDFGLARLYEHSDGQAPEITRVAGTFGYMAPEILNGNITEKSDVFSFGVVALEVVTGRRSIDPKRPPSESSVIGWVLALHKMDRILNAVDARLEGAFEQDEVAMVLHIGLLCSHPDPTERPTMRQVLQMLNWEAPLPPLPSSRFVLEPNFQGRLFNVLKTDNLETQKMLNDSMSESVDAEATLLAQYGNSATFSMIGSASLAR